MAIRLALATYTTSLLIARKMDARRATNRQSCQRAFIVQWDYSRLDVFFIHE